MLMKLGGHVGRNEGMKRRSKTAGFQMTCLIFLIFLTLMLSLIQFHIPFLCTPPHSHFSLLSM
jgi:hypothetical protein